MPAVPPSSDGSRFTAMRPYNLYKMQSLEKIMLVRKGFPLGSRVTDEKKYRIVRIDIHIVVLLSFIKLSY